MRQTTLLDDPTDGLDVTSLPDGLWVGTSSFSSPDWLGGFYPKGLKPAEFLTHYAGRLRTVEIDATWHAMPRPCMVEGWAKKVPEDFRFALKVPKIITHERALVGCEAEWERFLRLTELLGERRGPLLFQFPYVAKGRDAQEYRTGARFCERLERFLPLLPGLGEFVVEVRNEHWIAPPLLDLLRSRGIALALASYFTLPQPDRLMADNDLLTASFGYVRFLGHHKQMDRLAAEARRATGKRRDWDELLVDRTEDTRAWIPVLRVLLRRAERVYVYYNNHYAGNAPGSIELLTRCWSESDR
ncbi:MAG: DUF72 domain-containing protein [bacterium]